METPTAVALLWSVAALNEPVEDKADGGLGPWDLGKNEPQKDEKLNDFSDAFCVAESEEVDNLDGAVLSAETFDR
jgi:hypothetical protein